MQCGSCSEVVQCPNCSIALTVHQSPARLRCHYCAHAETIPAKCAECGHAVQKMSGVGTQQLERFLSQSD